MNAGTEQDIVANSSKMHCCVVVRVDTFPNNFCALRAGCLKQQKRYTQCLYKNCTEVFWICFGTSSFPPSRHSFWVFVPISFHLINVLTCHDESWDQKYIIVFVGISRNSLLPNFLDWFISLSSNPNEIYDE